MVRHGTAVECHSTDTYLTTYSLGSAMHELSLLLNYQVYIGEREPVHFYSFKIYN